MQQALIGGIGRVGGFTHAVSVADDAGAVCAAYDTGVQRGRHVTQHTHRSQARVGVRVSRENL